MILAVDVAYHKDIAVVGGVLFRNWNDEKPLKEIVISCSVQDNYMPGQFYRRELPGIAALLEHVDASLDCIIIDGFVYLGKAKEPGLGKHLRNTLMQKVAIIGVAKSPFKDTPKSCEILRGRSRKPLYVTADGISDEKAKLLIKSMQGSDRIPTLLKHVDRLCREFTLPDLQE